MKKYLITAAMAVALGVTFTSCHDDSLSGTTIDKKAEAFEEAFIRAFGQPDPNHTWGFGGDDEAITRGHNANANEWASNGWIVPKQLTEAQKNRVIAYFQNNQLTDGGEKPWTDFFVQQVYKGGEDNGSKVNIMNTNPALTTEKYKASAMSEPAYGSNQLDKLFANTDDHINNYNGGQCSYNYNVSNSEGIDYINPNGNQHTDQIMLMVNSRAKDFGYNCSQISIEYNDHYTLVDGSVIDQWAAEHGNNIGESVSGRAFVGFDFDLLTPDEWYTDDNFKITDLASVSLCTDANNNTTTLALAGLDGDYIYNEQPVKYLHANAHNMISGARITSLENNCGITDMQKPDGSGYWGKTFSREIIDNLIRDGYRPVKNQASTWVKPEITRDHYYSDWIVSIIPGEKTNSTTPDSPQVYEEFSSTTTTGSTKYQIIEGTEVLESGRVMCEDLGSSSLTDIDFNDIVFDAIIVREYRKLITTIYDGADATGNILSQEESYEFTNVGNRSGYDNKYALIRIMAAGGTIPATVAGIDVHDVLGEYPTTTMINTTYDKNDVNGANIANTDKAVDLTNETNGRKFYGISCIKDIEIAVKYANDSKKLKAELGAVPYKFKVPLGTPWAKERKEIDWAYPEFAAWVRNEWKEFWNYPASGADYDTYIYTNNKLEGLSVAKDVDVNVSTVYDKTENSTVPTTGKRLVPATHNKMDVPSSSEIKLVDYNPSAPGFLYSDGSKGGTVSITDFTGNKALQAGDVIRVYGVSIAGWEVNTTIASTAVKKQDYITDCGYFEIPIDEAQATSINSNGLKFSGKHFTITYVTILRSTTPVVTETPKPGQFWPSDVANGNATSQFNISASVVSAALANASTKNKICIYCTIGNDSWLKLNRGSNWPAWTADDVTGWKIGNNTSELEPTNGLSSVYNSSKGCVEVPLTTKFISDISSEDAGLGLNFGNGNMTVTNITIE